jgi:hypothetical protein
MRAGASVATTITAFGYLEVAADCMPVVLAVVRN